VMMGLQTRVLPLIRSNCCTGLVIIPISDGFTVSVSSDMYNSSFYSYMYYNSSKILLVNLKSYLIPPPVNFSYYIMYRFNLYVILMIPYNHLNFKCCPIYVIIKAFKNEKKNTSLSPIKETSWCFFILLNMNCYISVIAKFIHDILCCFCFLLFFELCD